MDNEVFYLINDMRSELDYLHDKVFGLESEIRLLQIKVIELYDKEPLKPIDGESLYTWVCYSSNPDGEGLTTKPQEDTKYIGVATNKRGATESDNPSDYDWVRVR